jgi:peptidoglycan hydrolase-like protein with peptidoglycan-binding domain
MYSMSFGQFPAAIPKTPSPHVPAHLSNWATPAAFVKQIKGDLYSVGYTSALTMPVEKWDAKTTAAIKAFQKKRGLDVTGKPDYLTIKFLSEATSLSLITSHPVSYPEWSAMYKSVTDKTPNETMFRVQEALYFLKFDPGPIDGLAGTKTTAAIKAWQKTAGLPVTGALDAAGQQMLFAQASGKPIGLEALTLSPEGEPVAVPAPPPEPVVAEDRVTRSTRESPAVTQTVAAAQAAGIPVTEKTDASVREPKIVIVREPVTQQVLRVEKLVPKAAAPGVSPWVWVGLSAGVVVVAGTVGVIIWRGRRA